MIALRGSWPWVAAAGVCAGAAVLLVETAGPVLARELGWSPPAPVWSSAAVATATAASLAVVLRSWGMARAAADEAAALRSSTDALEAQRQELGRMRETFLNSISHELRTPLSNLSLGAATIRDHHGKLPPELSVDVARRISSNAERLEGLLLDLLELGGGAALPELPDGAPVDVADLVQRAAERGRAAGLECRVDADVQPVVVNAAPLRRILEELVANVVRHTPVGTVATITARLGVDGLLLLAVEDDGPGIDQSLGDSALEPFVQGGRVAGMPSPGLGIGLSIAAHHARQHGGDLRVSSDSSGTRVEVQLPVLPGHVMHRAAG